MQEIGKRRKQIRQQQRLKLLCRLWQFTAVSGLTGLSLWWAMGQEWHIRHPHQIEIRGNRYIPASQLRAIVPVTYPQSIFQIEPQAIAQHLQTVSPVNQVLVERSVLPARLTIQVQERIPVAISSRQGQIGFLDRDGVWLPQTSYPPDVPIPPLTILEPNDRGIPQWVELYAQLQTSPLPIRQLDARDLQNIILITELGIIHCGSYRPDLFPSQLAVLTSLQALPKTINDRPILYYDVREPASPIVQTRPKPTS